MLAMRTKLTFHDQGIWSDILCEDNVYRDEDHKRNRAHEMGREKTLFYFIFHKTNSREMIRIRKSRGERSNDRESLGHLPIE